MKSSSFIIAVKNSKDEPIHLKQGLINKRSILTGEDQYFIIDLKPDKVFGAKIAVMFANGRGEIFARRLLRSEMFQINIFPDDINYEYMAGYKNMDNGLYLIEIPYRDFEGHSYCRVLLTVRGNFPGNFLTKIEYSIFVSNSIYEIITDKNYKLHVSQGEIANFHFKVGNNKKRLYISMTNKDKDANMFLSYEQLITNIGQYQWRNKGAYNEYIDLSISDPYFVEKGMNDLDGDYYLAIQGLQDTFYNLYISSQDVKIITITEGNPGVCSCQTENDNCYFRYENLNNPSIQKIYEKKIIFYTEYTYGSGTMSAKLYKNGNMDEILQSLPSKNNNDAFADESTEFLFMDINEEESRLTFNSIIMVGVQCKQKSLFDLSATLFDGNVDVSRRQNNIKFLAINQDNLLYLNPLAGITSRFVYYIYENKNLNFNIKILIGKAEIHTYINETAMSSNFLDEEDDIMEDIESKTKKYYHIADFTIDSKPKGKNIYFGKVMKQYGFKTFFNVEVKPIENCLININVNMDNEIRQIFLNKEIIEVLNDMDYYAYYDFKSDIDEVIITITSLEKNSKYGLYLKTNIININERNENEIQNKYSLPSSKNYDLQGKTKNITSSISLRVKNIPKNMRNETHIARLLINIECYSNIFDQKVKLLITPVLNKITRIRPEKKKYYFLGFENNDIEKAIITLKNINKEDDLMIIDISSCKGNFVYVITDSPPLETETYTQLKKRKISSSIYSSNGKSIITVRKIKEKNYYLTLFGAIKKDFNILLSKEKYKENKIEEDNKVEVLLFYYTTKEIKYNYLVTQDSLIYESKDNFRSMSLAMPELKKRDTFGKENNADSMNYTFIVSDQINDFIYMQSTCYLIKMEQKNEYNKFNELKVEFDKNINGFNINGLKEGKVYYMNILGSLKLNIVII